MTTTTAFAPVFHSVQLPSKPATCTSGPLGVVNGVGPLKTASNGSSFAFTTPKAVGLQTTELTKATPIPALKTSHQDSQFSFSAPKKCTTNPLSTRPYVTVPPHRLPKKHAPAPAAAGKKYPPLKNASVVDALRLPQFQPCGAEKGSTVESKKASEAKTSQAALPLQSLAKFAPPAGSWSCDTCFVSNKPTDSTCVACGSGKPGSEKARTAKTMTQSALPLQSLAKFAPPAGSWSCDTCLVSNKPTDSTCVACGSKKPGSDAPPAAKDPTHALNLGGSGGLKLSGPLPSLVPSTGIQGVQLLPSATALKGDAPKATALPAFGATGGLKLGSGGALKFGGLGGNLLANTSKPSTGNNEHSTPGGGMKLTIGNIGKEPGELKFGSSIASSAKVTLGVGSTSGGFDLKAKFAPPPGAWSYDTCMVNNPTEALQCVACSSPKPAAKVAAKPKLMLGQTSTAAKEGSGGFKLMTKFAPPPGAWSCDVCMISNTADAIQCVACSSPKPPTKVAAKPGVALPLLGQTKSSVKDGNGGFDLIAKFAPPAGAWSCDTCMVSNSADALQCVACSSPKPAAKVAQLPARTQSDIFGGKLGVLPTTSSSVPLLGSMGLPQLKPLSMAGVTTTTGAGGGGGLKLFPPLAAGMSGVGSTGQKETSGWKMGNLLKFPPATHTQPQ